MPSLSTLTRHTESAEASSCQPEGRGNQSSRAPELEPEALHSKRGPFHSALLSTMKAMKAMLALTLGAIATVTHGQVWPLPDSVSSGDTNITGKLFVDRRGAASLWNPTGRLL